MGCVYTIKGKDGKDVKFDDRAKLLKYVRDNKLLSSKAKIGEKPTMTTESLAAVLRQMSLGEHNYSADDLKVYQEELLDKFIGLEAESGFFYKMGSIIALTKGLGKSYASIDAVNRNLRDLGVHDKTDASIPFDVRYLLTGEGPHEDGQYYHKITANNVRIMKEVDALARTMFMERTPAYQHAISKVVANLKDSIANSQEKTQEIKDEYSAYAQLAAYKNWLAINQNRTDTLRNSLIYEMGSEADNIVDYVNKAKEIAPTNAFLDFILPVSTVIKTSKKKIKNINNKDLINTIEGKTRGKIEPDLISSLMDSFAELYNNKDTKFYAQALFDYLIVKDGLMFKNKSFIKMLPTLMFDRMSHATEMATRVMAANSIEEYRRIANDFRSYEIVNAEGTASVPYFDAKETANLKKFLSENDLLAIRDLMYTKVFGVNYNNLYHSYESIYGTDVRFQYNIQAIFTAKANGGKIEGIEVVKTPTDFTLNVNLFNPNFHKTKEDSDERKAYFKKMLDQLEEGGFAHMNKTPGSNITYLQFKKFIRVRDGEKWITLRLNSVNRDKNTYTGAAMTEDAQLIPRGHSAVYKRVDLVGTSNTTGVANLGPRPSTRDLERFIAVKVGEAAKAPQAPVHEPAPVGERLKSDHPSGIIFFEHSTTDYASRTRQNASADATIAIAADFTTAGEKLTKSAVEVQKKKYIPVDGNSLNLSEKRINSIVDSLNSVPAALYGISLNIAGNGLYTLKGKYTQAEIDEFTYNLLKAVLESPNLHVKIASIRTGGQTGFDEAGAKAGVRLGIPTTILAPKGWRFRNANGQDVSNEKAFKDRFLPPSAGMTEGNTAPTNRPTPTADDPFGTMEVFDPVLEGGLGFFTDNEIGDIQDNC